MKGMMMGLLAETPIHPGSGRGDGVIDLPVAREAGTDYPVLVGSSLKGALRDHATKCLPESEGHEEKREKRLEDWFGSRECAGGFLITEGRLLLLPVRSLTGAVRWATCPQLLERLTRDLGRIGVKLNHALPDVKDGEVLGCNVGKLFLEERLFQGAGSVPEEWIAAVAPLIRHQLTRERLAKTMVILTDKDFAWFARYGLTVQARNQLEAKTKQSKSLWYEETLPPDTLMYTMLFDRAGAAGAAAETWFPESRPYLQVGGNETVGQGWFAVAPYPAQGGGA
ncbi:type III-B CRISPR module RAMP protein Cmr4 [Acanthopleuribacter pedis]|uniref:Type III-B CRISPR module RAMP protein Cmr4 n=1 Tax=Acanthopleuribacter pedis TaxID=442870 RepID=A0A8J7U4A6_9BACT|nr:type III-B CRISPR module RAMP protein Cmr4 [Acanthopleuribacter pedis]MBO1318081.1 type III-B CRISPR module RAMP protein Cmr4 [Acanthopleuribacter pedis]